MALLLAALLSLGVLAFPGPAVAESARLTVDDAVRIAVERNLGLQVETYNPAIAETDIRRARSIYDPTLSVLLDHRGENLQTGPTSAVVERTRFFDANASLDQLLSTGATASAAFTNFWSKDNLGISASRFAQPELTLSLSQPLLKGFGKQVTERGITTADDAMDLSLADWNQKALDTAADARNRFLTLVKARESLATRKASLAVARRVHEENEARVKAGVLAAFELQDSELGVLRGRKTSSTRNWRKGTRPISFGSPCTCPPERSSSSRTPPGRTSRIRRRRKPSGSPCDAAPTWRRPALRCAPRSSTRRSPATSPFPPSRSRGARGSRESRPSTGTRSTTWGPGRTRIGRSVCASPFRWGTTPRGPTSPPRA